jgi:hypothetical protein
MWKSERQPWSLAISLTTSRIIRALKKRRIAEQDDEQSLESGDTLITNSSLSSSSKTHQRVPSTGSTKPAYENKGVQADLSPPPAPQPSVTSNGRAHSSSSSCSNSTSRPQDTLPPLDHYDGVYPTLTFPRSLTLPHWTLDSGKCPEVSSGTPLNNFTLFSQLPTELRLKIWRTHLLRPRLVRISTIDFVKKLHFVPNALGNPSSNIQWYTTNRLPVLMRVCHESRDETLRFYRVHLSHEQRTFYFSPVYLNPEWDVLLLNCTHDAFPMDVFLSDVMAYDPKGVGAVHLGSYLEPSKWDCEPLAGCAELARSARNLMSYTECAYAGTSMKVDVFPILRIGEGYLMESVSMAREKFASFLPRLSRNLSRERSREIQDQLGKLLPKEVMEGLSMQTLFTRSHQHRLDPPPRSLATVERAAGLVLWDAEGDRRGEDGGEFMYFSCS